MFCEVAPGAPPAGPSGRVAGGQPCSLNDRHGSAPACQPPLPGPTPCALDDACRPLQPPPLCVQRVGQPPGARAPVMNSTPQLHPLAVLWQQGGAPKGQQLAVAGAGQQQHQVGVRDVAADDRTRQVHAAKVGAHGRAHLTWSATAPCQALPHRPVVRPHHNGAVALLQLHEHHAPGAGPQVGDDHDVCTHRMYAQQQHVTHAHHATASGGRSQPAPPPDAHMVAVHHPRTCNAHHARPRCTHAPRGCRDKRVTCCAHARGPRVLMVLVVGLRAPALGFTSVL